jgi:kumamolisin
MRSDLVPTVGLAVLLLAATLGIAGPTGSASSSPSGTSNGAPFVPPPIDPTRTTEVAPAYDPGTGVTELGPLPSSDTMAVAVGLSVTDPSDLAAELEGMYLPGSPWYHHFLSTSVLAARFGATPTELSAVAHYFESFGARVSVSPDDLLVDVSGSPGAIGAAFGTSFDLYRAANGSTFVSHPSAASLPDIAPWTGALGLGNTTSLRPAVVGPAGLAPLVGPAVGCGSSTYVDPCQVWGAYDMDPTTASTDGTGETIGVVDTYDDGQTQNQLATDLSDFDSAEGLPSATVNYLYPVGPTNALNTTSTGWDVEEALDLEWSHASAPGATIDMTFSPNPNVGLYQAVDYLVAHQSVNVISMSWGEPDVGVENAYSTPCSASCNASTDGSYDLLGPILEFAAAEGISVFAASGDCGAADGTSGDSTNFPASSPYVTGVGGTELTVSSGGVWESETGWSGNATGSMSPGCDNQGGSGGGYSPFSRPWWQYGLGLPTGRSDRGVPDVSAISMPGAVIYFDSSPSPVGGTSLGTPIWAGIAALADQHAGTSLGLLNPSLYAILRNPGEYSSDFHDITSGNNGYPATAGWDPVTGIGSPLVGALLPELAAGPTNLSPVRVGLNVSESSGLPPLSDEFVVSASGGTGQYTSEGVYFGDGIASFAADGTVNHTYTDPGVYSAQAYAVDSSGNFSVSLPIAVVVGGGSAIAVNLTPSEYYPAANSAVTFSATPHGGIGPYQYLYYFGDGTSENWTASASVVHSFGTNGSFCASVLVQDSAFPVDGGVSPPVPIAVGSASVPVCASAPSPLVVTANSTEGVRDAPADFPDLFTVSGGAGTVSLQYRSSDPYVAACACDILRAAGNYSVHLYANESIGPPAMGEANVTVAPALNATFTASPTFGPAPLSVTFGATARGGYRANASLTAWSFGNGAHGAGASVRTTYATPGLYWAVGHLSDRGDGNASRAFLIDVGPSGPSAAPYLAATVAPVENVSSGTTVVSTASAYAWNGSAIGANLTWRLGARVLGYEGAIARTIYAPAVGAGGYVPTGNLTVVFATTGGNETVGYAWGSFFAEEAGGFVPRADALTIADGGGPSDGPGPLFWSGVANAAGPGGLTSAWTFGDGANATGPTPTHTYYSAGLFTVQLRETDSWGDVAQDADGVDVTSNAVPLALVAGPSVATGPAPLAVDFSAAASGGAGPPYTYSWEFGDGGGASAPDVTHVYTRPGAYLANVTATDSHGETFKRAFTITVTAPATLGPILGLWPRSISLAEVAAIAGVAAGLLLAVAGRRWRNDAPPTP